jgi:hypothetical protein
MQLRMPSISDAQLRVAAAAGNNQYIADATKSSGKLHLDNELWSQVAEEKDAGWLSEPVCSLGEAKELWGEFVLARRFPLQHGDNVRLIDDLNESNTNLAFGYSTGLLSTTLMLLPVLLIILSSFGNRREFLLIGDPQFLYKAER